jgi:hypothetical protein
MVAAEPRPGKIPTSTPSATPMKQNNRFIGWSEMEKPRRRFESACIAR